MEDKPKFPLLSDLPEIERIPFEKWLAGQTCPFVEDKKTGELKFGYYPWDYERWKRGQPVID